MCRLVLEITFPTNGLKVKKKGEKNKRGRGGWGERGGGHLLGLKSSISAILCLVLLFFG